MTHQLPTMADIQTTDLLYYEEANRDACYRFCEERDIDLMPSVDDQR